MNLLSLNTEALNTEAIILTVVGYFVVFSALVLLYFVFYNMPKLLRIRFKRKKGMKVESVVEEPVELTGEVNAAISMALYLHFNQYHDIESTEMTIVRESRLYSPWSSKIYQVRNQFNRL
jgi:Na+-transporting methylmalonyl-CoA/oxaloacetate decarboxylase gamma subunit